MKIFAHANIHIKQSKYNIKQNKAKPSKSKQNKTQKIFSVIKVMVEVFIIILAIKTAFLSSH